MSFIRKKKINNGEFAYLVTNRWTNKGSRQKAEYIGKVVKFGDLSHSLSLQEYIYSKHNLSVIDFFNTKERKDIVNLLAEFELLKRGFIASEIKGRNCSGEYLNNSRYFFNELKIMRLSTGKEAVAEMNEGYLCSHSINQLLKLEPSGYDEREQGIMLAKALLESGISVGHDIFVMMFEKWTKPDLKAP